MKKKKNKYRFIKKRTIKRDKKNLPLISIITVVLNNKKFLQQSINSVANQTYKNYELIIVDGKSTDGTINIIKKNNSKIDFWVSEKDKGIYDAMNKGMKLSRGSLIVMLNSDDVFYKHALKNTLIPFITIGGLQMGSLFAGAIVTERIFAWPGMGRLILDSIQKLDYPVVMCWALITACIFIVINLIVDISYSFVDPRIRAN